MRVQYIDLDPIWCPATNGFDSSQTSSEVSDTDRGEWTFTTWYNSTVQLLGVFIFHICLFLLSPSLIKPSHYPVGGSPHSRGTDWLLQQAVQVPLSAHLEIDAYSLLLQQWTIIDRTPLPFPTGTAVLFLLLLVRIARVVLPGNVTPGRALLGILRFGYILLVGSVFVCYLCCDLNEYMS